MELRGDQLQACDIRKIEQIIPVTANLKREILLRNI